MSTTMWESAHVKENLRRGTTFASYRHTKQAGAEVARILNLYLEYTTLLLKRIRLNLVWANLSQESKTWKVSSGSYHPDTLQMMRLLGIPLIVEDDHIIVLVDELLNPSQERILTRADCFIRMSLSAQMRRWKVLPRGSDVASGRALGCVNLHNTAGLIGHRTYSGGWETCPETGFTSITRVPRSKVSTLRDTVPAPTSFESIGEELMYSVSLDLLYKAYGIGRRADESAFSMPKASDIVYLGV